MFQQIQSTYNTSWLVYYDELLLFVDLHDLRNTPLNHRHGHLTESDLYRYRSDWRLMPVNNIFNSISVFYDCPNFCRLSIYTTNPRFDSIALLKIS
jgi:hypothetical protein